jgi:acyl-coenzyme A thioesterase PaaI-like protein
MSGEPVAEGLDDPRLVAAARAGAAGRRFLEALIASRAPTDLLDEVAAELDRLSATIGPHAVPSRYSGTDDTSIIKLGDPLITMHHPVLGAANPIAPPLTTERHDDGWVTLRGTYDKRFEGLPGLVHGGILAMGFDLALGIASAAGCGRPAMTGTLTLRYRSPTPLHQEVVYRAVAEPRSERTQHVQGTLHVEERLCVEAEGIWVITDKTGLPRVEVGE